MAEKTTKAPATGDTKSGATARQKAVSSASKRGYGTTPIGAAKGATARAKGPQTKAPRVRRSGEQLQELRAAMFALLEAEHPMTVRQMFYRMTSAGLIPKTERAYKGTVCQLLKKMRLSREIPFSWIADNTRSMRKPLTHKGLDGALVRFAQTYRRDLWEETPVYVEIWLEKDALSGVLFDVTREFDVPLMVTRGYSSLSFLYGAAEAIEAKKKPAYIYYFGDFDPSGVNIPQVVERGLRELAPNAEIHFERVAVNESQIEQWNLPTRPTKKTDSRSKNFGVQSVEVDAIPSRQLRELARECIERHIDRARLDALKATEQAERETLRRVGRAWRSGAFDLPSEPGAL